MEIYENISSIIDRIEGAKLSHKQVQALGAFLNSFDEINELRAKLDKIQTQVLRLKGATEEFLKQHPLESK